MKWIMTGVWVLLATFSSLASSDASVEEGKVLYEVYCTQCHGKNHDGQGVNVPALSVQPRDHTDTGEMTARTDAELFEAIKFGGKSVNKSILMPAWQGNMTDEQIHSLVAYLRELCCNK